MARGLRIGYGGNRTLSAANGVFTLSGQAANLNRALNVAAAQGSFAVSGQAATLTYSGSSHIDNPGPSGSSSFSLLWDQPLYDATGAAWTGGTLTAKVEYGTSDAAVGTYWKWFANASSGGGTVSGLASGATYSVRVTFYDSSDNPSAPSEIVTKTT